MYKLKKLILCVLILIFSLQIKVFAGNNSNYNFDFVESKQIDLKEKNVEIKGEIPVINKFKNNAFEKQINQRISNVLKQRLDFFALEKIKNVSASYKIKANKNIISILIYFSLPEKINYLETINFNIQSCNFLSIKNILGANSIDIINKIIKDNTIASPEKYNINFLGINNEYKNFYVNGDEVNIFFNPHELTPGIKNIELFKIKNSDIKNKFVSKKNYYLVKPYDVKMIGIREICEAFDFKINFNQTNNFVQVLDDNLSVLAFINKNFYIKNKEMPKTLESQVIIKNNKSYAPISFFQKYLGLFYSIDENGNIIFSKYNPVEKK